MLISKGDDDISINFIIIWVVVYLNKVWRQVWIVVGTIFKVYMILVMHKSDRYYNIYLACLLKGIKLAGSNIQLVLFRSCSGMQFLVRYSECNTFLHSFVTKVLAKTCFIFWRLLGHANLGSKLLNMSCN